MLPDEFDSPESDGAPERIRGPGPKRELSKLQLDTEKRLSEGKFLYDPRQIEARRSRTRKSATAEAEAVAGTHLPMLTIFNMIVDMRMDFDMFM